MTDETKCPVPTPVKAPLPCYGTGYNSRDRRCQACPHKTGCLDIIGPRLRYIPLSKAVFQLVPANYNYVYEKTFAEDPEIAALERTYVACYRTIFTAHPPDRATPLAEKIAAAARRTDCSIRLYMLANMMGHCLHQADLKQMRGRAKAVVFTAKHLLGKIADNRARNFRDVCAKDYGAFSVGALGTMVGLPLEENSPEAKLLTSEVKVGQFIVDWKTAQGGPVYEALYKELELTLDPLWLAIEESYKVWVLDKHLERPRGTALEKNHRFAVIQAIGYLKKHKQAAFMAFVTRQNIMPKAVSQVLGLFGYGADDFRIFDEPVTDTLNLWTVLGLAVQHHLCLRYLDGEPVSLFRS